DFARLHDHMMQVLVADGGMRCIGMFAIMRSGNPVPANLVDAVLVIGARRKLGTVPIVAACIARHAIPDLLTTLEVSKLFFELLKPIFDVHYGARQCRRLTGFFGPTHDIGRTTVPAQSD